MGWMGLDLRTHLYYEHRSAVLIIIGNILVCNMLMQQLVSVVFCSSQGYDRTGEVWLGPLFRICAVIWCGSIVAVSGPLCLPAR